METKLKSIQFRLFLILCISIMSVIFIIVIVNNVVLETFYKYSKTETAKQIFEDINNYYNGTIQYDIEQELRQIEIKNNIQILIQNQNEIIYFGNKDILNTITQIKNDRNLKTIYKNDKIEIKNKEISNVNNYIVLIGNLENGYTLYIKIPMMPIKESVRISNKTLILIGIMMIIVSACIASFISKKFTKPILQLNNITKKMSKLDFSEKYKISDTEDEINMLGKNINLMSEKLEATIGQLRQNNDALEKDIEEKLKIDEMRKQFISDVSHELKTPISLIQGYAEGLLENVNSDEESRKFYSEVIIDESNKMDKMVKELLELMKLEYKERKFDNKKFDLTKLVNEEIRRHTVVLNEKNITVEFDQKKKINVFADYNYIERIINNYLTNAIKHCQNINDEKKIIIRAEKTKKQKIRLYVYNTGERIPEEYINKIWDRFYKVDVSRHRENGGTGIGLAVVKAIMNNYGNEYGVNNLQDGVEFYFDIDVIEKKQI